jgi:hypothetical protein
MADLLNMSDMKIKWINYVWEAVLPITGQETFVFSFLKNASYFNDTIYSYCDHLLCVGY